MKGRWWALASVLALAGCAGKPTTYLALAPVHGVTHAQTGPAIAVARVRMPAAIDRLYLTSATGANVINVANHVRWVAPLGGQAQAVLARDLAVRLPGVTVLRPGDPTPKGGARLVLVNVTRFWPAPGGVVLDAGWVVEARRHKRVVARGRVHIVIASVKAKAGAEPAIEAGSMSVALGRLADVIAARLGG